MSVYNITNENFEQEVLNSEKPVFLDFWAKWCGPCKMLSPVIDQIAKEVPDAKICKVDVDEQPELARAFKIMSVPTIAIIKDGKIVNTSVGIKSKSKIKELLNAR